MLKGRRPMDLATALLSPTDCALADQVRPAIEALEQASSLGDPP